jgi:signal peptidase I
MARRPNNQGGWMQSDQESKSRTRSALREFVETILITLLIYFLVRTFLFENYRVLGQSMHPTLENGQYLVINKLLYRLQEPQRGDIIVFRDVRDDSRKLIKRIIGLPGETVEIQGGQLYIDDRLIDEPYIDQLGYYSEPASLIPDGHFYVLGDNRNNSSDSHSWGTLPGDKIVGKAWLSYWPPAQWGIIPHETYATSGSTQVEDGIFGRTGSQHGAPGPPTDTGTRGNRNKPSN